MDEWPEIEQCESEKRRELVLKGPDIGLKIDKLDGHLPEEVYKLNLLNFLEISDCGLAVLSDNVEHLSMLAQFIVNGNILEKLPDQICSLKHLKVLDISYNNIDLLPEDFGELSNLQSFNANNNRLANFPGSARNLLLLSSVDISNNKFTAFPQVLLEGGHIHLSEVKSSHNEIEHLDDGIGTLVALKTLDLSGNKLKELPQSLANCSKLKQADYRENPLKDRRLKKLIEQNNSSQKAIMEYIRTKGRPPSGKEGQANAVKGGGKKKKKGKNATPNVDEDLIKYVIKVLKISSGSGAQPEGDSTSLEIIVSDEIKDTRPYIVCCIVKRLNLSKEHIFKKFIAIQTKLHEEVCGKRTIATIASHDLSSIGDQRLNYDAKEPDTFKIHPLGRDTEVTGLELYKQLRKEAEDMKREKKRSQVSGIYKYLSLLENQEKFAYLSRSSDDAIISLPPLTNSDITKMKMGVNDVLLEVTGTQNLGSCKSVMDKLLRTMLEEGMYSDKERDFYSDSSGDESTPQKDDSRPMLTIQQVKILDSHGKLKVVYPSRTDLDYAENAFKVERPH